MLPREKDDLHSFGKTIKLYTPLKTCDQRQGHRALSGHVLEPEATAEVATEDVELKQHGNQGVFDTKYGSQDDSDDEDYTPLVALPCGTYGPETGSSAKAAQTNTTTSQAQTTPFDFQQQILMHLQNQAKAHQRSQDALLEIIHHQAKANQRSQDTQLEIMRNLQAQQKEMREQAQKDREMQAMMFQYTMGSMGYVFQHIGVAPPPFHASIPSPVASGVAPFPAAAAAAPSHHTPVPQPAFPASPEATVSGGAASLLPAPVTETFQTVQPAVVSAEPVAPAPTVAALLASPMTGTVTGFIWKSLNW
ncbi:hypothetical protein ACP4OV_024516 [Aristida adscensionis]